MNNKNDFVLGEGTSCQYIINIVFFCIHFVAKSNDREREDNPHFMHEMGIGCECFHSFIEYDLFYEVSKKVE